MAKPIPPPVDEKLKRGRARMQEGMSKRKECWAFWRDDQYKWTDSKGALQSQATTSDFEKGQGKPAHISRTTRNLIFDIVEHEVTTSATTNHYASPAATCEAILNVYQDLTTSSTNEPMYLPRFQNYRHIDSDLFSTELFFVVWGGVQDGTQKLYVNCRHPLAITTVTDPQMDVVRYLACAHLLEWGEPRAIVDQNERKAKVGDRARLARYFRDEGKAMLKREAARLQKFAPPRKEFLPRRPRVV